MVEVNNGEEPILPAKRTSDLTTQDPPNDPKKPKLDDNGNESPQPHQSVTKDEFLHTENRQEDQLQQEEEEQEEQEERQQQEEVEEEEEEEEEEEDEPVIDRKGKGILIEEDEDDDDEDDDDSDSDLDSDSGSGSDFADDPLAEVDLDNILPSRTRRKTIDPGAYHANDLPDEDSDESDDPDA